MKQKEIGDEENGGDVTLESWHFGARLKRGMYASPVFSLKLSASFLSSSSPATLIAFLLKGQMPVAQKPDITLNSLPESMPLRRVQ